MGRLRFLVCVVVLAALAGCGGGSSDEAKPLSADSTCEERYEAVMRSPSVEENGSDGIEPKDVWIANCEGEPVPTTDPDTAPVAESDLGAPVPSGIGPAVVPPEPTVSTDGGNYRQFDLPAGVTFDQIASWYREHMPPGEDFEGLTWLEDFPVDTGVDWYWCSGPAESLDVSLGQNDPEDGGQAFIGIALQDVSDGACG